MRRRAQAPIETTVELVDTINSAIPAPARFAGGHPAKRSFQALRIAVNDELGQLDRGLPLAWELLREGGVLAGISFHSLEDRRVKRFLTERARGCICPPEMPVCGCGREAEAALLARRAIMPTAGEVARQPARGLGPAAGGEEAALEREARHEAAAGGHARPRARSRHRGGDPMTPPAASAAAAAPAIHPRRTTGPRRAPATRRPRRVSGPASPARTPGRRAPARHGARPRRACGRAHCDALGLAEAVATHRLLDRLIRGRVWIGVIAFALIGIVTMQLVLLKLNAGIGRSLVREALLQRENATLSAENSEAGAGEQIEAQAARDGMELIPAGTLRFLTSHSASDVEQGRGGAERGGHDLVDRQRRDVGYGHDRANGNGNGSERGRGSHEWDGRRRRSRDGGRHL